MNCSDKYPLIRKLSRAAILVPRNHPFHTTCGPASTVLLRFPLATFRGHWVLISLDGRILSKSVVKTKRSVRLSCRVRWYGPCTRSGWHQSTYFRLGSLRDVLFRKLTFCPPLLKSWSYATFYTLVCAFHEHRSSSEIVEDAPRMLETSCGPAVYAPDQTHVGTTGNHSVLETARSFKNPYEIRTGEKSRTQPRHEIFLWLEKHAFLLPSKEFMGRFLTSAKV